MRNICLKFLEIGTMYFILKVDFDHEFVYSFRMDCNLCRLVISSIHLIVTHTSKRPQIEKGRKKNYLDNYYIK